MKGRKTGFKIQDSGAGSVPFCRFLSVLFCLLLSCALHLDPRWTWAMEEPDSLQDTMLMFVGEAEPVVTVASRLPESPADAPAMVTVIGREEIDRYGYQTLAELLAGQPGFFMSAGGRGTAPYLRGLRNSVLFLYDGVPMTTDVTKNFAPLDEEISLAAIESVEIVRGPGSILWGPDAFAGVVNIIPKRGRQHPGLQAELMAGTERTQTANITWGQEQQQWDAFLSLGGNRNRFYSPDFLEKDGDTTVSASVDPSEAAEFAGTLHYGNWLQLSGRWSEFTRRYTMRNAGGDISWAGEKETPVNLIKATATKVIGPSHYTFSGFFQELDYRVMDADVERGQNNRVSQLSLLWDRRLLSRGLFTVGASWRQNSVTDAVVQDGFLPDFLAPGEKLFAPRVEQEDFVNELASLFSQFRYRWGETEWWVGGRLDDHSQYRSTESYSFGFNRFLTKNLRLKTSYGNAFRSPYSSQLFGNTAFEPESIQTVSLQLAWTPSPVYQAEMTLFQNKIRDHRVEDPYGGLSLPAEREYHGMEVSASKFLSRSLVMNSGISLVASSGEETFESLLYSIVRPDGSEISVYDQWDEPLDQGPGWQVNLGLNWQIGGGHNLMLNGRTGGRVDFSYDKSALEGSYASPVLLDLTYRCPGFLPNRDTFTLKITNLLDQDYLLPDIYGSTEGPPLKALLGWQVGF